MWCKKSTQKEKDSFFILVEAFLTLLFLDVCHIVVIEKMQDPYLNWSTLHKHGVFK